MDSGPRIANAVESFIATFARGVERMSVQAERYLNLYERHVIALEQEAEFTRSIAESQGATVELRRAGR